MVTIEYVGTRYHTEMPKNTARLGKNGMKITTISALIYESKLALYNSFLLATTLLFLGNSRNKLFFTKTKNTNTECLLYSRQLQLPPL